MEKLVSRSWVIILICFLSLPIFGADFYKALELSNGRQSSPDEIKRAYRRLALRYHPDRNPGNKLAEEKFKEVQKAYDILSDESSRRLYDQGNLNSDPAEFKEDLEKNEKTRRPESGFFDPTGIGSLNNSRINFLNDTYVEMRETKSPAEALIATLRKERGMDRPRILWWGRGMGNDIYESQTQYVFDEFMREIMDDLFYASENITSPNIQPRFSLAENQNALARHPKNELSFSRRPTLQQIMEIHKLYGMNGYYFLMTRSIQEASSKTDLVEFFHYGMRNYYYDILRPGKDPADALTSTRKGIVTLLEPALRRVSPGTNVPEFISEFILSRLSRLSPTDRKMTKNLFAILKDIATPEAMAEIQKLVTNPRANGFVRRQVEEILREANPKLDQKLFSDSLDEEVSASDVKPAEEVFKLDAATIEALRAKLAAPTQSALQSLGATKSIDEQFEAAAKLFNAGELNESDIKNIQIAVYKYFWRYRSPEPSKKIIDVLLKLAPTHPEVNSLLARAIEEGWGYPAEDIAIMAMEHNIQWPDLLEAFREFISSGIEDRFEYQKVVEALGRLGDPKNKILIETLRKKAAFRYSVREPEPESYEAAIALGRLGAKDSETVAHLRTLMRKSEAKFIGAGVPYAAALALAGVRDDEIIGLLKRELTHSPNGFREHQEITREALDAQIDHPASDIHCKKIAAAIRH